MSNTSCNKLMIIVAVTLLAFFAMTGIYADDAVSIVGMPTGSIAPSAVVDSSGILHVVYGSNHNAFYIRSTDNGRTFTQPVKVNSTGTVETEMGERGPKLAVGKDGVIHVVWMDDWATGVQVNARYARSVDGGKTFSARQTLSSMYGVDGVTVVADTSNHVIAFWHVMQAPGPPEPQATWPYMARSLDNGATFATNERLNITNHSGSFCSMCMMSGKFGSDGRVTLVFRSAAGNIRDHYLLTGSPEANSFTATRVNTDNWNINYCPMTGPNLSIDASGRLYCGFLSASRVYWAKSEPPYTQFTLHVATPLGVTGEIYATAVANSQGHVLFVWQEGPMATGQTATVKWACYTADGVLTGQQGTIGTTDSGTKATAVVGSDDSFIILTTAKPWNSLPSAKIADNGTTVTLDKPVVTARFSSLGCFYVEEPDRSCALKVASGQTVSTGDKVAVTGQIGVVGGERQVTPGTVSVVSSGNTVPAPVGMTAKSLGGADLGYCPGVGGGTGLNNVGMLVRTVGRITSVAAGYFYIDDGSKLTGSDGTGVKVTWSGAPAVNQGDFVMATGICSVDQSDTVSFPVIRTRSAADITSLGAP